MEDSIGESATPKSIEGFVGWFLLTGNRFLVSIVLLLVTGVAFFLVGILGVATVTKASRVMWYLNGTVNGLLTLIPISVGVNQIVLSHEFGSIQSLYERRTDITEFRERVEEQTDTTVISPHASAFFSTLLSSIADAGRDLQYEHDCQEDGRTRDEIRSVATSIVEEADQVNDELDAHNMSMLQTLLILLEYDNSRQFYEIRRLQNELSDSHGETLDELEQIHELFVEVDAGRQFLKTVVVERQLARLSRLLIYTGIPAVTVAILGIFVYRDIAGLTVPHTPLVIIAGAIIVATLVPLAILGAYILRVATIARQTAMYGPFILESDN